ncbi:MAG: hypothetical protein C4332_00720 [Meiothermus sp.]
MRTLARMPKERIAGPSLDWAMAALSVAFVAGLFLDGWAHTHGKVDQSFFTPWHAVLYSGFALNFLSLLGVAGLNRSRGYSWSEALPEGYGLSLLGMSLWLLGGPGDLVWHTLFGIEEDINALYSPTHLLLATGLVLAASGPWRAMWTRPGSTSALVVQLPMLLSLAASLSALTFFVQFAHPVTNRWGFGYAPVPGVYQALGVTGFILINALVVGALLISMRRWRLGAGAFTLVLGLNAFAMGFLDDSYPLAWVTIYLLAGALLDGLYRWLNPEPGQVGSMRLFAVLASSLLMALYFALGRPILPFNWSPHMVGGMVFIAGVVGFFLSLLMFPPTLPTERDGR